MVTAFEASAQRQLVGIAIGANRTNVTSSNFLRNTDYRLSVSGGLTYEYFLKENFSIGADITYNQRGFTDNYNVLGREKVTDKTGYNYLAVPVKAGFTDFTIAKKVFGFAKAGLVPSLLTHAETTTPTLAPDGSLIGVKTLDITTRVSEFDLAGLAEIGAGYSIQDRLSIEASVQYQHSLTSVTNADYYEDSKIRNKSLSLNFGLKWALKRNK